MKKLVAVMLVAGFVFAACSSDKSVDEGGEGALTACGDAPAEATVDGIPSDFPKPDGVTYTGGEKAGPSVIAEGYYDGDLPTAVDAYKTAFRDGGYSVTKDEQEDRDAEVFFESDTSSGQVNMFLECEGRVKLRITIRPAA